MIYMFHFLRPYWFLALFLLVPLMGLLWKKIKNNNNWDHVIDKHLLPYLLINNVATKIVWPFFLLALTWFIAVFALAGPTWSKQWQPVYQPQAAKVIVLDTSQSMLAQDIKPNGMIRAKYKVLDILRNYPEGQTGMVAFASEAYTVSPLTTDTNTIAAMVPDLDPSMMPVSGNDIAVALKHATQLLQQANSNTGTIILLTDSNPSATAMATAKKIQESGYKVSVLAILNQNSEVSHNLQQLAIAGGGQFSLFTNDNRDINNLMQPQTTQVDLAKSKKSSATVELWQDEGHWFILLLLPLVLLLFRRGWLGKFL